MSVYQIPHSKYDTLCMLHIFLTLLSYNAVCHIMLCVKLNKSNFYGLFYKEMEISHEWSNSITHTHTHTHTHTQTPWTNCHFIALYT